MHRNFIKAMTKLAKDKGSGPKPPAGPVPKFNDTFRGFPRFAEDIRAYRQDYWKNLTERTIVNKLLEESFSKDTAEKVGHFRTMEEILERLSSTYSRPSKFIESLMTPYRKHGRIGELEYGKAEKYLSSLIKLFEELRSLDMWHYFDNVQNVETISANFSAKQLQEWLAYQREHREDEWTEANMLNNFVDAQYPLVSQMADLLKPKFEKSHDAGGDGKGDKKKEGKGDGPKGSGKESGPSENVSTNVGQVEKTSSGANKPAANVQSKAPRPKPKSGPPPAKANPAAAQPQQGAAQPKQDNTQPAAPPRGGMSPGQAAAKRLAQQGAARDPGPKKCSIPGCGQHCPKPAKCEFWLGMACNMRWKIVAEYNLCDHCLRHPNRDTCYGLNDPWRVPYECGVGGCKEFHHSTLHAIKETGHVGVTTMHVLQCRVDYFNRVYNKNCSDDSESSDEEIVIMNNADSKKEKDELSAPAALVPELTDQELEEAIDQVRTPSPTMYELYNLIEPSQLTEERDARDGGPLDAAEDGEHLLLCQKALRQALSRSLQTIAIFHLAKYRCLPLRLPQRQPLQNAQNLARHRALAPLIV